MDALTRLLSLELNIPFEIIYEGTGKDMLEFRCYRASFYDLLEPAGVDIMFHLHTAAPAVLVNHGKPFPYTVEKFDMSAETLEFLTTQAYPLLMRFIEHQLHVRQHIRGILPDGDIVAHAPEFFRCGTDGLD